jgi:hypothetical protein
VADSWQLAVAVGSWQLAVAVALTAVPVSKPDVCTAPFLAQSAELAVFILNFSFFISKIDVK